MSTRRHRSLRQRLAALLAVGAALAVAACGGDAPVTGSSDGASGGAAEGTSEGTSVDAATLIEDAVAAQAGNDPAQFAALVDQAGQSCLDPSAALRLTEIAAIADRWAEALADGRPKVQAVTEQQLSGVDWTALSEACAAAAPGS